MVGSGHLYLWRGHTIKHIGELERKRDEEDVMYLNLPLGSCKLQQIDTQPKDLLAGPCPPNTVSRAKRF